MIPADQILSAIGTVLMAGGGGAAVTFLILRFFGDQWLRHHFARELEQFKHKQMIELEQSRQHVQAALDRQVRLHKNEYEVLPEAWAKMRRAHDQVAAALSPFQSYTDVSRMSDEDLLEHLAECPFSETERTSVMRASKRQERYIFLRDAYKLHEAKKCNSSFYEYITVNALFLRPSIEGALLQQVDLMHKALVEAQVYRNERFSERSSVSYDKFVARFPELERFIRKEAHRALWNDTSEEAP